jgi:hypothetical protein
MWNTCYEVLERLLEQGIKNKREKTAACWWFSQSLSTTGPGKLQHMQIQADLQ